MNNQDWIARHEAALTLNYGKMPATLVRGEGSHLWDADGRAYIDFFAGFGGTILGHAHPALVAAVTAQAQQLWAVGNQFYTEPQVRLAERIQAHAFDGRAFFCHSGAEANEAALKLARLFAASISPDTPRYKVISMEKGFHGRTMGALSATPTREYQRGFLPLVPGFVHVPFNDLAALEAAIDAETCAVILEPIQGEGGLHVPSADYLAGVRALCNRHRVTLIFDEVWTGCGRTGKFFAFQHAGVTPDILTLGKALGGGLPVGCMFARPELAALLKPGTHGCTLGGNPICAAAAATVLEVLHKEDLPARAAHLGNLAMQHIRAFKNAEAHIRQVRGQGLMIGIELLAADAAPVVKKAFALGLIINATQKNVLRLSPALTLSESTLATGLELLEQSLDAA